MIFFNQAQASFHDISGDDNDILLLGDYEYYFRCTYDLLNYPFDTQICSVDLSIPVTLSKSLKMTKGVVEYHGPKTLIQFEVTNTTLRSNDNNTKIQCLITLKRNPLYHVTATYLPTFCILMMAMVTLYIDEQHFEATIMVALTAMLVMYTLFQSIAADMPSTAYLKLLDFWLIFGLIMPFIVFIALVMLELTKRYITDNKVQDMYKKKPRITRNFFKRIMQIGLPLCSVLYITGYCMKVFSVYRG